MARKSLTGIQIPITYSHRDTLEHRNRHQNTCVKSLQTHNENAKAKSFKQKIQDWEETPEKISKKTGAKWTEERKRNFSEIMKEHWKIRKSKNKFLK